MLNLTRLHLGIAHESQFQGLGISERLACEAIRFKKRNISATIVADVKRFSHQINTGEVFDTHRSSSPILQSLTFWYPQGNA